MVCVGALFNIPLAISVAREFGELEFRTAGASENQRPICENLQSKAGYRVFSGFYLTRADQKK